MNLVRYAVDERDLVAEIESSLSPLQRTHTDRPQPGRALGRRRRRQHARAMAMVIRAVVLLSWCIPSWTALSGCDRCRGPQIANNSGEWVHVRVRDGSGRVVSDVMVNSGLYYRDPLPVATIELLDGDGNVLLTASPYGQAREELADHSIVFCIDAQGICTMGPNESSALAEEEAARLKAAKKAAKQRGASLSLLHPIEPLPCPCPSP